MSRLVKGRDGQVRGARLKVLSKAGKQSSVHRFVQRLISFEIREKSAMNGKNVVNTEENRVNKEEIPQEIEVQGAVIRARRQLKDWQCASSRLVYVVTLIYTKL